MFKVSIISPIYNKLSFLDEFWQCLGVQNLSDKQIILVDDGSTDGSLEKLLSFSDHWEEDENQDWILYTSKNNSILILHLKQNQGISVARYLGVKLAKGKYIGFADPDDVFDAGLFDGLYETAKNRNADCVWEDYFCGYSGHRRYVSQAFEATPEEMLNVMFDNRSEAGVWNKLFRRTFVERNGVNFEPRRISTCDDFVFQVRFMLANPVLAYRQGAHYHHVFYKESLSHTHSWIWCKSIEWIGNYFHSLDVPDACVVSRSNCLVRFKLALAYSKYYSDEDFLDFLPHIKNIKSDGKHYSWWDKCCFLLCIHGGRRGVLLLDACFHLIRRMISRIKNAMSVFS